MAVDCRNRIPRNIVEEIDAQYRHQLGRTDTILLPVVVLTLLHYRYQNRFGAVAQRHPVNHHITSPEQVSQVNSLVFYLSEKDNFISSCLAYQFE